MLYGFACSLDQVVVVVTLVADGTENSRLALNGEKFAGVDNQFQLIDKRGSFQIVQRLQFCLFLGVSR